MLYDDTLVVKPRVKKVNKSGPCLMKEIDGIMITLPKESLCNNSGKIRKQVAAKLSDLTVKNLMFLNQKYGITAEKANGTYGA